MGAYYLKKVFIWTCIATLILIAIRQPSIIIDTWVEVIVAIWKAFVSLFSALTEQFPNIKVESK